MPCIPYRIDDAGQLWGRDDLAVSLAQVADTDIEVGHLIPFVFSVKLPQGDLAKVLVSFTSHCWTESFDEEMHAGKLIVLDHTRHRVFDAERYALSKSLPGVIAGVSDHKCFLTPEKRNYMTFDGRVRLDGGRDYRIFFSMKKSKGRWNGARHQLHMIVESAYPTSRLVVGTEVSFTTIVSKTLRGEKIRYVG